jgi:DNA-binding MarR family transcriptional regulator
MSRIPEPQLDAWRAVVETYGAVTAAVEHDLAEAGLPPLAWYDALYALYAAPGRMLRMSELAVRVARSRGGTTKLVDRLESQGLLERRSCAEDRRVQYAVLLRPGTALMRKMWPVYATAIDRYFANAVADPEADVLREVLRRARDSVCDAVESAENAAA